MKNLLIVLLLSISSLLLAEVEYYPVTGIYVAKSDGCYLRTYEGSPIVHKCYGIAAADHFTSKEEAEKLIEMYKEQHK